MTFRSFRRTSGRGIALLACLLILVVSCSTKTSADGDDADATKSDLIVPGVVQSLWVLDRVVAVGLEGDEIDLSKGMVALAGESDSKPFTFAAGSTFTASSNFQPEMVDVDGRPIDTVDLVGGIIETTEGERSAAILATPDEGVRIDDRGYTIEVPIPPTDDVTVGTPIVTDLAMVRYLPIADASGLDDDGTALELLKARAQAGAVVYPATSVGDLVMSTGHLGIALDDNDDQEAADTPSATSITPSGWSNGRAEVEPISRRTATLPATRQDPAGDAKSALVKKISNKTAERMGIPADARPLIDSIADGALETLTDKKCRSATCIKKLTDKIEEGLEESLEKIEEKLDIDDETPDDNKPSPNDPGPDPKPMPDPKPIPDPKPLPNPKPKPGDPSPDDSKPNPKPGDPSPDDSKPKPDDSKPKPKPKPKPGGNGSGGGGGSIWADPHVRTFDNKRYSLQVIGELVTARSTEWEVQTRLVPVECDCIASVIDAVVVSDGAHDVEVRFADRRVVTIDGDRQVDLDERRIVTVGDLTIASDHRGIILSHDDGDDVRIGIRHASLDVTIVPDGTSWTGLFGNANGDPTDDFQTPDGESFGPNPETSVITTDFADSWRVTDESSLFTYAPGESTKTFTDATFPAPNPDISSDELAADRAAREAQAVKLCELSGITDPDMVEACVFDFVATGNPSFASAGRDVEAYQRSALAAIGLSDTSSDLSEGAQGVHFEGAELREAPATDVEIGSGLALVSTETDKRTTLHAIDTATGSERWTSPDVARHCRPTVMEDIGVVAELQKNSPTLGDDNSALVLLSLDDGSELARFVPPAGEALGSCDTVLASVDDVVVHRQGPTIRAFSVGDDITPLWRLNRHSARQLIVVDDELVSVWWDKGVNTFETIDPANGQVTASLEIDGGPTNLVTPAGDGLVAAMLEPYTREEFPRSIALLDVSGDTIREKWLHEFDDDEPRRPPRVARVDDVLVGWSQPEEGAGLVAWSVTDGSQAWSYKATSFDNSRGLATVLGDEVLISPFGGSWLEILDADGNQVELIDAPDGFEGAAQITAVDKNTVIVTGRTKTGTYVTFVER